MSTTKVARRKVKKPITERVIDVESACAELGRDFSTLYEGCADEYERAEKDIKVVAEALREGAEDAIWFPWFIGRGSGFRLRGAAFVHSASTVGARLRVPSAELARHLGKILTPQYQIYLDRK